MLSFPPTTYEKMSYVKAVLTRQTELPMPLVNLTCDFLPLDDDFDLAKFPLIFGRDGQIRNPRVRKMIREALISNVCELNIKRQIFLNLLSDTSGFYHAAFEHLLHEISQTGYQVNLDYVDLSHLELVRLPLMNMSLKYADFSDSLIHGVNFTHTDLNCAKFIDSELRLVNMAHVSLFGSTWDGAILIRVNLSGAQDLDLAGAQSINGVYVDDGCIPDRTTREYRLAISENDCLTESIQEKEEVRYCCVIL